MLPATESEAEWFYKKPLFNDEDHFMTVFIREAPAEENTASESIRTVAATSIMTE